MPGPYCLSRADGCAVVIADAARYALLSLLTAVPACCWSPAMLDNMPPVLRSEVAEIKLSSRPPRGGHMNEGLLALFPELIAPLGQGSKTGKNCHVRRASWQ